VLIRPLRLVLLHLTAYDASEIDAEVRAASNEVGNDNG